MANLPTFAVDFDKMRHDVVQVDGKTDLLIDEDVYVTNGQQTRVGVIIGFGDGFFEVQVYPDRMTASPG